MRLLMKDRLERAGFLLGGDLDPDQTYVEVRALLRTLRASSNTFGQDLLDAQESESWCESAQPRRWRALRRNDVMPTPSQRWPSVMSDWPR